MTSDKCQGSPPGNDSLVFIMRTDPEPIRGIAFDISECAVVRVADPNRPNFADFLEVKRRQSRICKPKTIGLAGVAANRFGKLPISFPKSTVR